MSGAERVAASGEDTQHSGAEGEGHASGTEGKSRKKREKGPRQHRRHKIKRTGTVPEVVLRACVQMMDLAQRFKLFRVCKMWRLCARDSTLWLEVSFRERPTLPMAQLCQAIHWAYDCHHLDLTGCRHVTDLAVAKIGWRLHRLSTLILAGTSVRFHNSKLAGAMERLGNTLTHLDISRCRLDSLDLLSSLKRLEHFEAVDARFPSLLPLKAVAESLKQLRLSASSCSWNQIIEVISAAPGLSGLHINKIRDHEGSGLRHSPVRGLKSLSWGFGNRAGDNNVVKFVLEANAETLEEAEIPASESLFDVLQTCKRLHRLTLVAPGFRRKRSGNGPLELEGLHSDTLQQLVLDGHFEFDAGILQHHPALSHLTITQTRIPDINTLLSTSWQLTVLKFVAVGFGDASDLTIEDQTNLECLELTACGSFSVLHVHGCPNLRKLTVRYCTPLSNLRIRAPQLTSLDLTGLHQLDSADIESDRLRQIVCTRFPTYSVETISRLEAHFRVVWLVPTNPQPEDAVREGTIGNKPSRGGRRGGRGRGRNSGRTSSSAPFAGRWKYWTGKVEELYAPTDKEESDGPKKRQRTTEPLPAMDED